jgi:hypothetical protein
LLLWRVEAIWVDLSAAMKIVRPEDSRIESSFGLYAKGMSHVKAMHRIDRNCIWHHKNKIAGSSNYLAKLCG